MSKLKNKYVVHTLRTLFALFFLFSGIGGLFGGGDMQGVPAPMIDALVALQTNGLFYMIKITEVIAGLMLLFNIFPALAVIFLAPIAVGVVVFNAMIAPVYVVTGLIVCLIEIYFGYVYWDQYKPLFMRKKK